MAIAEVTYTVEPLWTHEPQFNGEDWPDTHPSVPNESKVQLKVSFKQDGVAVVPTRSTTWAVYPFNTAATYSTPVEANPSNGVFTIEFVPDGEGLWGVEVSSGNTGSTPYVYVTKRMYFYVHRSNVDPYVVVPYS